MKAKLKDVVCIITDKKSSSLIDVNNYVSTENILPNREGIRFPAKSLPRISKILSYQKNDVLVSNIRPYFKKIWFSDRDGVRSNDVLAFRTKNSNILLQKYLYLLLQSDKFFDYVTLTAKGTKMPRGDKKAILNFTFELPSISTQKKLTNYFFVIESLIKLNNLINDNLLDLVDTLFDNIIKCSILYKATLNDIGTIAGGGTPSKKVNVYWNGKIPWLTPKDLSKSHSIFTSKGTRFITEYGLKESSARLFPAGTVLFSSRAPIGYISIAKNNISTSQGFKSIIPNKGYSPEFIYELLKKETPLIVREANGSTFKEISGTRLKAHIVNIPSKEKAKYFDNSALSIFKLISKNENENKILKNLKKELLNKIF